MSTTDIPGRPRWCKESRLTAVVRGYNEFLSEGFNAYAGEDEFSRGIRHGFTLAQIHYLKVNAPLFGDIEEDNNG